MPWDQPAPAQPTAQQGPVLPFDRDSIDCKVRAANVATTAVTSAERYRTPSGTGNRRIKGLNLNDEHSLDKLLEEVRMSASTEWECEFAEDMSSNREKYGMRWRPTDAQIAKMRQIAGEGDDDEKWNRR